MSLAGCGRWSRGQRGSTICDRRDTADSGPSLHQNGREFGSEQRTGAQEGEVEWRLKSELRARKRRRTERMWEAEAELGHELLGWI